LETVEIEGLPEVIKTLKDKLKPYNYIVVTGSILADSGAEEVEVEEDGWGKKSKMLQKRPGKAKLFIDGAEPKTLDKELYTKKIVESYADYLLELEKEKSNKEESFDSQEGGNWGKKSDLKTENPDW
jgi:hypothetical protein